MGLKYGLCAYIMCVRASLFLNLLKFFLHPDSNQLFKSSDKKEKKKKKSLVSGVWYHRPVVSPPNH